MAPYLSPKTPLFTSQVRSAPAKNEATFGPPDRLALGHRLRPEPAPGLRDPRFLEPDMLVLGANDPAAAAAALALYPPFNTEKLAMDLRSADWSSTR